MRKQRQSSDGTHTSDRASRGRWLAPRLALALLSLALALTAAEVAVRFFVPQPAMMRFEQNVKELKTIGLHDFITVIENDPDLFWRLVPSRRLPETAWPFRGVISNSQRLREDHEVLPEKRPGELRILFLGDSCTFGYGLLHTEGFVHRVETMLQSKFPQARWECVNAGVPGYSLFQGLRFLELEGSRYQPDLIVLNFGWNDGSAWDGVSDQEHYRAWMASQPVAMLRWSRLCQIGWAAANRPKGGDGSSRPRLLPEEFRTLLPQVHEAARRSNAELLLLVWPYRGNIVPDRPKAARDAYQHELLAYGRSSLRFGPEQTDGAIDFVPLAQEMAKDLRPDAIFLDHGHATSAANEVFARAIVEKLAPWAQSRLRKGQ